MAAAKSLIVSPRKASDRGAWASILLTGDAAYVALGYPVAPADFDLTAIDFVLPAIALDGAGNFLMVEWDPVNLSARFFYPTGSTLAAPAAVGQPILNAGAVAVTASAATGPFLAGAGKELPAGAGLAAFSVRLVAFGQAS